MLSILLTISPLLHAYDDHYFYVETSVGHWVDGNYSDDGSDPEVDGRLPITFSAGMAWDFGNFTIDTSIRHRSNLDHGWPFNNKKPSEYQRAYAVAKAFVDAVKEYNN